MKKTGVVGAACWPGCLADMGISIQEQGWAMFQALLMGGAAGVLYDLLRILRVRVPVRLLGSLLDLLFWVLVTAGLFLWSLDAWGGLDPVIWGGRIAGGRSGLLSSVQHAGAEVGVSCC